jgi:hypothetical protein
MDAATQALRSSAQLPEFRKIIGGSSVDFFGYNQIYILFNELNYRPAPLIQSFMACDEKLARLNEAFYLSPAAPEYVVFTLASPDRKFPPLDDGRLLRALLFNYELAGKEGRFLLLRKKSIEAPKLTLLKQGVIEASQPIDLRSYQSLDLWLDIDMKPSLIGRMRQILYRAPTVRLASWREPQIGLLDRRRSPPSNLAAGFVASPLLVRTESVEALFGGKEETRPGAYSVELGTNDERWWERSIRYRVYSIQRGP